MAIIKKKANTNTKANTTVNKEENDMAIIKKKANANTEDTVIEKKTFKRPNKKSLREEDVVEEEDVVTTEEEEVEEETPTKKKTFKKTLKKKVEIPEDEDDIDSDEDEDDDTPEDDEDSEEDSDDNSNEDDDNSEYDSDEDDDSEDSDEDEDEDSEEDSEDEDDDDDSEDSDDNSNEDDDEDSDKDDEPVKKSKSKKSSNKPSSKKPVKKTKVEVDDDEDDETSISMIEIKKLRRMYDPAFNKEIQPVNGQSNVEKSLESIIECINEDEEIKYILDSFKFKTEKMAFASHILQAIEKSIVRTVIGKETCYPFMNGKFNVTKVNPRVTINSVYNSSIEFDTLKLEHAKIGFTGGEFHPSVGFANKEKGISELSVRGKSKSDGKEFEVTSDSNLIKKGVYTLKYDGNAIIGMKKKEKVSSTNTPEKKTVKKTVNKKKK